MGIFDKMKGKKEDAATPAVAPKAEPKPKAEVKPKAARAERKPGAIKGKTAMAYRVLVKPLITEKASRLSTENKYVFSVNPDANKIEIMKAIRSVYNVNPVNVRIVNVRGKHVRYGRTEGETKAKKKAIVTLREGDKIEVYEGV
jgi:large subunit ribosomal protein L23